ncbi:hypothetical protein [Acidiphilium sp.]|uniref:hypothetical protein n=1 Tax=Acidiphilium sp. TaxID=527 RepID=UPI003D00C0BD
MIEPPSDVPRSWFGIRPRVVVVRSEGSASCRSVSSGARLDRTLARRHGGGDRLKPQIAIPIMLALAVLSWCGLIGLVLWVVQ